MQNIYVQNFTVTDATVDRYGRLKLSTLLYFAQEVAGQHFTAIAMDYDTLAKRGLFWAIVRQRVQITRLPLRGESIRVETWPMPTTRVAYPRSVVAYDEQGEEVFRCISLWVLMDLNSRGMILPDKSGISVEGVLRGNELAVPAPLALKELSHHRMRPVCFTDLDRNGHMNNTRYLDWIDDLLSSEFHAQHTPKDLTVCYLSEAREGQELDMRWGFPEEGCLNVDAFRTEGEKNKRIFSAKLLY